MEFSARKHNIENIFVLIVFGIFSIMILLVLVLGANSYHSLVKQDRENYESALIPAYVCAKVRSYDTEGAVSTGAFSAKDDRSTLHLYQTIEGETYDTRIYYYKGYIYELFTLKGADLEPEAGNKIYPAAALTFSRKKNVITLTATDQNGTTSQATVGIRSGREASHE